MNTKEKNIHIPRIPIPAEVSGVTFASGACMPPALHQSTNQPEAQQPTWRAHACVLPTNRPFSAGGALNSVLNSCGARGGVPLARGQEVSAAALLAPLDACFSVSWGLGSALSSAVLASILRPGQASLRLVQRAFLPAPLISLQFLSVLEAVLISGESTEENVKTPVGPRRIRRKVGVYWCFIKRGWILMQWCTQKFFFSESGYVSL